MKNILSPVLAFCLVLTHVYGEEVAVLPVVTPQEAAAHEGKQVKVKGVVDGQKTSAKGITYLNFGGRFPNHVFSCVLRSKDFPEGVPSYEGKEVEVTGLIKMYEGKPSMEIKSMDQIHMTSGDTDGAVSTPSASPTGETER